MKKVVHELNHNQIASRGKIFLSATLDFCLHMILLMIIYGCIAGPIISYGGFLTPYENSKKEFFNYVEDTKLYTFNEKGEPVNSEVSAAEYVGTLVKTSYFYEGKTFTEMVNGIAETKELTVKDTIGYQENGVYVNDNLAYYFFNYRTSSTCDLPDEIKNDIKTYSSYSDYFYRYLLKFEDASNRLYLNSEIFVDGKINEYVGDKPILDSKYADLLYDYIFLNKPSEEGEKVLRTFSKMYHNAVNSSFEELTNHSESYNKTYKTLLDNEVRTYTSYVVGLFLSYALSFTIYWIIIPIFLKEGKTLGMKFNRLTYSTTTDKYPSIKNIAIKDAILFLTQGISLIFPVLFLGSSNLLFLKLGTSFKLIYVMLFFALATLLSVIMAAWGKKHQFLCEYTSLLVQKDTDSLKVKEENEVID